MALVIVSLAFTGWAAWAAGKAANAAEKAVAVASETAQRELRAYLFANRWTVRPIRRPGDPDTAGIIRYDIGPIIENSGSTPARHVMCSVNFKSFGSDGIPEDFDYADKGQPYRAVLGPRSEFDAITTSISIELLLLSAILGERFFIWGWIEYNDAFAGTPRHRTEFCCEVFPQLEPGAETSFSFVVYGPFNGADEECRRQPKPHEEQHL